jgi:hypothetical protein
MFHETIGRFCQYRRNLFWILVRACGKLEGSKHFVDLLKTRRKLWKFFFLGNEEAMMSMLKMYKKVLHKYLLGVEMIEIRNGNSDVETLLLIHIWNFETIRLQRSMHK